ncbi:uncharacterized protein EAF02_001091 [Botrytis sinoallii]|uniref:uncharacterized protein n=1 Tax=Botrytis sinoallii TaxID=1463999 RepID=UPI00190261C4|nr:uncharacterized protein EAF02_001091 [Botrytis sinoallii]KAF7893553.1 hypothetical protein EAF02_001091 [Botrytis sinoallii]
MGSRVTFSWTSTIEDRIKSLDFISLYGIQFTKLICCTEKSLPQQIQVDIINARKNYGGQLSLLVIASDSSIPVDTILLKKHPESRWSPVAALLSTLGLPEQNEVLQLQVPGGIKPSVRYFRQRLVASGRADLGVRTLDDDLGPKVNEYDLVSLFQDRFPLVSTKHPSWAILAQKSTSFVCRAKFGAHTPTSLYFGRRQAVREGNKSFSSGYLLIPVYAPTQGSQRLHMPFRKGMQWPCCLALDPGVLTSDEDEPNQEFEAERIKESIIHFRREFLDCSLAKTEYIEWYSGGGQCGYISEMSYKSYFMTQWRSNTLAEDSEIYQGMLAGSPIKPRDRTEPDQLRNLIWQS